MRGWNGSVSLWVLMVGCAAGLTACGGPTVHDDFPAFAHSTIEGTVLGTRGQPLDSVNVSLGIPPELDMHYSFGQPGALTGTDGSFLLPLAIYSELDSTNFPDTVRVYVRAAGFPPKYAPPPGEEKIADSVLVAAAMEPPTNPAPRTDITITLPVP
jgi:hypothetical protein